MKKPLFYLGLLIVMLASGCIRTNGPATLTPTVTSELNLPTPTAVLPVFELPAKVERHCSVPVSENVPHLGASQNVLFFEKHLGGGADIELLTTTSATPRTLAKNVSAGVIRLSPNGSFLAWDSNALDTTTRELVVEDVASGQQQHFAWEDNWTNTENWGWASDTTLWLREKTTNSGNGITQTERLIFDSQAQTSTFVKTSQPPLPDLDEDPTPFASFKSLDPQGQRIIYTVFKANLGWGVALRDLKSNKELWSVYGQSAGYYSGAEWAEDGSRAILSLLPSGANAPELFGVSGDGKQIVQLTALGRSYQDYRIRSVNLSSDGQRIAFWLYPLPAQPVLVANLMMFDLRTNRLFDLCLQGILDASPGSWSSDSNLFLFQITVEGQTKLMLYNFASGKSQVLVIVNQNQTQLIGWTDFGGN